MLTTQKLRAILRREPSTAYAPDCRLSEDDIKRMAKVGLVRRFDGIVLFKSNQRRTPGLYPLSPDIVQQWTAGGPRYMPLDETVAWVNGCDPGAIDGSVVDRANWELARGLDTPLACYASCLNHALQAAKDGAFGLIGWWASANAVQAWFKRTGRRPIVHDGLLHSRWRTPGMKRFDEVRDAAYPLREGGFDPWDKSTELSAGEVQAMLRARGMSQRQASELATAMRTETGKKGGKRKSTKTAAVSQIDALAT
jgi:hypothetical protein